MSEKQGLWGRNDPMKNGAWREISLVGGHAYDPAGSMTGLTYPDGRQVAYAWDANNRLPSIFEALAPSPVLTSKTLPPYASPEGGGRGLLCPGVAVGGDGSEPQRDHFDNCQSTHRLRVLVNGYFYAPLGERDCKAADMGPRFC
jgi:YD repeat-containing protein